MKRHAVKLSTTIVAVALLSAAATALAASAFGYSLARKNVDDEVSNSLRRDARRLARAYVNSGAGDRAPGRALGIPVAIVNSRGNVLGRSFDPSGPLDPCAHGWRAANWPSTQALCRWKEAEPDSSASTS